MDLLFSFAGRIGRGKWWLGTIIAMVIYFVLCFIVGFVGASISPPPPHAPGEPAQMSPPMIVGLILATIPYLWMVFAVGAKRCHDRGRSGWFQLIGLIPVVGGIWLLVEQGFLPGVDQTNEYGPPAVPRAPMA